MAEKTTTQTSTTLTPPFPPQPIPPTNLSASQQPNHASSTSTHLTALSSLPTILPRSKSLTQTLSNIPLFIASDLDLSRLNRIHTHLWMAGRPMRARPLHRYKMLGMTVLPTQQMDLHLLRYSTKLLLKPLPEYLLDHAFWTQYICPERELHESAAGFLLSYVWLVTSPLDLKFALEEGLVPAWVDWGWWTVYGYNRYVVFFQRNFSWILSVFVFFSLVLSAMQVGLSFPADSSSSLQNSYAFIRAAFVFVVFSMVSVVVVLAFVTIIFIGIFAFNMVAAISHARTEQKKRKQLARQKEDKDRGV
ncbi:hypothetical protein PTNB73_06679 [Pyrenophora teres f. teres]|nr:hypothetical protein HRS9122_09173 [Pyrenophora teres f. teres]KAE8830820.1 hypothetical protein PTNB85_07407 [Pyrenophora teres f. teres]KAE8863472.1 hypothetical protein PTNB73_06679 [Pyrenophora teres f. teres]